MFNDTDPAASEELAPIEAAYPDIIEIDNESLETALGIMDAFNASLFGR